MTTWGFQVPHLAEGEYQAANQKLTFDCLLY